VDVELVATNDRELLLAVRAWDGVTDGRLESGTQNVLSCCSLHFEYRLWRLRIDHHAPQLDIVLANGEALNAWLRNLRLLEKLKDKLTREMLELFVLQYDEDFFHQCIWRSALTV